MFERDKPIVNAYFSIPALKTYFFLYSDTTIKYGPYANIAPFSESEMVIHAENNNHMLVVTQLLR